MTSAETTDSYEICYNVISHINFIIWKGGKENFLISFKHFFLKYDEPTYIKFIKLEILSEIATDETVEEICTELNEYVTDVNHDIAKRSIQCFGQIILNLPESSQKVSSLLTNFIALQTNYITSECILILQPVLLKYRNMITVFETYLTAVSFDLLEEEESKTAYIWILGEFGS